MNKQRLLNVARALRESPNPEMFTMKLYLHSCGTPACALGHYGVRSDLQDEFYSDEHGALYASGGNPWIFAAAKAHFDLRDKEADELFDSDGCGNAKTAIDAAEYIEKFVARHEVAS